MNVHDFKSGYHIGIHGLGTIKGIPHTNSKETFIYWKNKGFNFFEADIAISADNHYVLLAHNAAEKDLSKLEVFEKPIDGHYSLKWLKEIRTCKRVSKEGLTIITLDEFLILAGEERNIVVMIDTYGRSNDDILNIADRIIFFGKKYPDLLERVLLELYSLKEIKQIKSSYEKLHIIASIREEGYDFWDKRRNYDELKKYVDFISCKCKYLKEERELIDFCRTNSIGVLSLSRFDNAKSKKKKSGVNINLVDVSANGNIFIYLICIIQFAIHFARVIGHKNT